MVPLLNIGISIFAALTAQQGVGTSTYEPCGCPGRDTANTTYFSKENGEAAQAFAPNPLPAPEPYHCNCNTTSVKLVFLNVKIPIGITYTGLCVGGKCEGNLVFGSSTSGEMVIIPPNKCISKLNFTVGTSSPPPQCPDCPNISVPVVSSSVTFEFEDCPS